MVGELRAVTGVVQRFSSQAAAARLTDVYRSLLESDVRRGWSRAESVIAGS